MEENIKEENKKVASKILTKDEFTDILSLMEKLIQGKIESLKTALPALFTIITSVITFFFLENFSIDMNNKIQVKMWLVFFCGLLVLLVLILIGNFSVYKYKSKINIRLKKNFKPWDLSTYIWSGDEQFLDGMERYAGFELSENEKTRVNILKEKVNEFRIKNIIMCIVHAIIMLVLAFLVLTIIMSIVSL